MALRPWLRLLLLMLGGFYLGGVCELNAEECRQNFAKECHEYVVARAGVEVPAAEAQPATPVAMRAVPRWRATPPATYAPAPAERAWPPAESPPPRRRRWLWCAVLQV